MGKKDKDKKKDKDGKKKTKDKCCEKYLRKNKHCKGCPLRGQCEVPGGR